MPTGFRVKLATAKLAVMLTCDREPEIPTTVFWILKNLSSKMYTTSEEKLVENVESNKQK